MLSKTGKKKLNLDFESRYFLMFTYLIVASLISLPIGLNSGVLLMNLTKMREFHFEERVFEYYEEFKTRIEIGDQDILNILFHFYPEKMFELPCNFNYRTSHW